MAVVIQNTDMNTNGATENVQFESTSLPPVTDDPSDSPGKLIYLYSVTLPTIYSVNWA